MSSRSTARFLSSLASLAAAVSPFRPGTAEPASSSTLRSAPTAGEGAPARRESRYLRGSLRACMSEGLVAEIISACSGGAVLTGWAIYLGAGPLLTGIVVALPQLAQLFQIPAAWTTALMGQRRAAIVLVAIQRQIALPLIALPFLPVPESFRQGALITVAALAAVLGVLGNNAWVSWMGDLVPKRLRGRYFGRRAALCTMGGALASAVAGVLLDWSRRHGGTGAGLAGLQLCACVCGVVTTILMARQHDPNREARGAPSLRSACLPLRDRSVRGFLGYLLAWNAAIGVAGSFFSLHMLRNLKMGFTLVALQGAGVAFVRMLAAPFWGALIDRVGARPVIVACSFGISAIPFIWLFPTETCLWPLGVDAVLTGLLWSGHNLAAFNLPLAVTPRAERPFYLGMFAAASGVAFALATAASGLLVRAVPERITVLGHGFFNLQLLFALSGVLRLGASFIALRIHGASSNDVAEVLHAVSDRLRGAVPEAVRGRHASGARG